MTPSVAIFVLEPMGSCEIFRKYFYQRFERFRPPLMESLHGKYFAVLDPERGEAISNEDVRHGAKVTVVALKANPLLLTEEALKVVGPRAFGYEFDYLPFSSSRRL